MKVRDVMTRDVITVSENTTLLEAAKIMATRNISGLPVLTEEGVLAGIVSESDVIRLKRRLHMPDYIQLLENLINDAHPEDFASEVARVLSLPVREFMTKRPVTVKEETSVAEAARLMSEHGFNRLPVLHNRKLTGIVTRRDLLWAMVKISQDLTK